MVGVDKDNIYFLTSEDLIDQPDSYNPMISMMKSRAFVGRVKFGVLLEKDDE